MTKILLVVPYKELQGNFESYVAQMDTLGMEIDIRHLYGSRFDPQEMDFSKYRVIAARGITAHSIREQLPKTALVEISVTGDDIITSLSHAVEQFGRQRIAVVLPTTCHCNLEQIASMCSLDLEEFRVRNEDDIVQTLDEIQNRGIQYVVGGLTMYRLCQQRGVAAIMLETTQSTIRRTVTVALETARSIDRARAQSHLMRTLLDHHHDGVLACDKRGQIISANTRACHQLIGSTSVSKVINRHIDDIIPNSGWQEVLESGTAQETMRSFSDGITIMQCSPMTQNGQRFGLVFTIQNADMIRANDSKIQQEVMKQGFTTQYTFRDIMAKNSQMLQRLTSAQKYARTDANVLILGETGTGKELFAQSIHSASSRSSYPFVAVNCAALPEHLLESELFGYSEGAFSGAKKGGKKGLFETAHKGTIFLDEIGEMPINLQAKLLRVLQERNIRRVGDNRIIPVDVRVISATNISIQDKIAEGKFRSDLYYRINLLELRLPPLRERPEDVQLIFANLLERFSYVHKFPVPKVSPEVHELMGRHTWPGNVRELRNFSERLVILSEGHEITAEQLELAGMLNSVPAAKPEPARTSRRKEDIARELGISRTTLWRRSKQQAQRTETEHETN